jgi:hypothetical protein
MTVRQLLANVSSAELTEWRAYFTVINAEREQAEAMKPRRR